MEEIIDLLRKNRLDEAFEFLSSIYGTDPEKHQDLILLINRYNKLKRDTIRGIITYDQESALESKLILDTSNYLRSVQRAASDTIETPIDLILRIINGTSQANAYSELNKLLLRYPASKNLLLGFATLDIRTGLDMINRSLNDERFQQLYMLLEEANPKLYKTIFCLLIIYKYEFYDKWEIPLPVSKSLEYNLYIEKSDLIKEFLLKMRLSPRTKLAISFVHKNR